MVSVTTGLEDEYPRSLLTMSRQDGRPMLHFHFQPKVGFDVYIAHVVDLD